MNQPQEIDDQTYQEFTESCRAVLDKIKKCPNLLDQLLFEIEFALIQIAMRRSKGNKAAAARLLGINRTTLVEKIKKLPPFALTEGLVEIAINRQSLPIPTKSTIG